MEMKALTTRERESISVEELMQLILRCLEKGQQEPEMIGQRLVCAVNRVWELLIRLCPTADIVDGVPYPYKVGIRVAQSDFAFAKRFFEAIGSLQKRGLIVLVDWEAHPESIQVEAGIFDLVYALNRVKNTQTNSSCQGHQYVDLHTPAFVGIWCPFEIAIELAQIVCRHQGFSIDISYQREHSQQVVCRIEIRYIGNPPNPDLFNRPLKQLQAEFIEDMESTGLLTDEVTQMVIPFDLCEPEGIFLPDAQKVIDEAFQTAAQFGQRYVDCEHLLLALLKNLPPRENVLQLFDMLHVLPEQLVQTLEADLKQLPLEEKETEQRLHWSAELVRSKVEANRPDDSPKLTRDAAEALRRAAIYARERGQRNVSGFHLAHGICRYLLRETKRTFLGRIRIRRNRG
ncbi:TPA: hypothetical protein EYP66_18325 [Candidatus Poribacteria bacterium]|nr:hypothetical protein [Candidatus Poribacteria bacterium]